DNEFCAQLVKVKLLDKGRREGARAIQKEAAAIFSGYFRNDAVNDDLSLRRQQRAKCGALGRHLRHVAGQQPMEKLTGIVTHNLPQAPIGQYCSLRHKILPLLKSLLIPVRNYGAERRLTRSDVSSGGAKLGPHGPWAINTQIRRRVHILA